MKILQYFIYGAIILFSCKGTFNVEENKNQLNNINYQIARSIETGDVKRVEKYLSDKWKLNSSSFGTMTKKVWLTRFFPNFLPGGKVNIITENIDWFITPTMAVAVSEDLWKWAEDKIPGGKFYTTSVYEKRGGEWKVILVHQSPTP